MSSHNNSRAVFYKTIFSIPFILVFLWRVSPVRAQGTDKPDNDLPAASTAAVWSYAEDRSSAIHVVFQQGSQITNAALSIEAPLACATPVRIMPLGDSITHGSASGVEPDDAAHWVSYRRDLWASLKRLKYNLDFVGSLISGDAFLDEGFDPDNEGHPGWQDGWVADQMYGWLSENPAEVVLLHIGTNEVDPSPDEVERILVEIDRFEGDSGTPVIVILARIVNRSCSPDSPNCPGNVEKTTQFNQNIAALANDRIDAGDQIVVVDMEDGAGLNYARHEDGGDFWNELHPFASGYTKMAAVWKQALIGILPICAVADSTTLEVDSGAVALDVLSNDVGEGLSITAVSTGSAGGSVSITGGKILYQPAAGFTGTETFTYTIVNGIPDKTSEAMVTAVVTPANDPPQVFSPGDQVSWEGQAISLQIQASDPEGQPLIFSASPLPSGLAIDPGTGLISGVLVPNSAGDYPVLLTVSDGDPTNEVKFILNWRVNQNPIYIPTFNNILGS